jgi:glutamyl-tRNA(Gln) amidotransferase subunit E
VALIAEGFVAKEAFEELVSALAENPGASARELAERLGITRVSREEASGIIERILRENLETLRAKGPKAFNVAMGLAMRELRGKVEGRVVAEIVREKLEKLLKP